MSELFDWGALIDQVGDSLQPLPNNDYDCEIIEAKYKQANSGSPMWVATFKVLNGPYANRRLWNNFVLTKTNPNAMVFFFRHMAAMGLTRDFFAANPGPNQVAEAMVGRQVRASVGTKTWNGETRNEIKGISALGSQAAVAMTPGGGLAPNIPGPGAQTPAAPAAPSGPSPVPGVGQGAPVPTGIPAPQVAQVQTPTPTAGLQGVPAPQPQPTVQQAPPVQAPAPAPQPPQPQQPPAAAAPQQQSAQPAAVESNTAPVQEAQQPAQAPAPAPAPAAPAAQAAPAPQPQPQPPAAPPQAAPPAPPAPPEVPF